MISISLCMIVKNEEPRLAACLDSLAGLMDEIVIVDTGSTDHTVEIAGNYTDRVHHFCWTGNFSDARNYAFSLCTKDYIYSADADELLDEENRERFRLLKECMTPEIEIVQMYYCNQLEYGTVYNFDRELRPKLFKRLRTFTWIEPIHETVRLDPVVFDSEIEIIHKPASSHAGRDIAHFEHLLGNGEELSDRLLDFYLREVYLCGEKEHLSFAADYLKKLLDTKPFEKDDHLKICSVLVRAGRVLEKPELILQYGLRAMAIGSCSEICSELGAYYEEVDADESIMWYYNGWHETESLISIDAGDRVPLEGLVRCCEKKGLNDQAEQYRIYLDELS